MKQNIVPKIALVTAVAILISDFLLARAVISISFYIVIGLFLINRDFSFDRFKIKVYIPLLFFLFSGLIITLSYFYAFLIKGQSISVKDLLSYFNPIILVLYAYSLSYFLSKDARFSNYLLYAYLTVVALFSLLCFIVFMLFHNIDLNGIYSLLGSHNGDNIQGVIAFVFPFISVIFFSFAVKKTKTIRRIFFVLLGLLVISVDLLINTSRAGYIVEFIVLIYYAYILLKRYSFSNEKFSIKKFLTTVSMICFCCTGIFYFCYKESSIFRAKTDEFVSSMNMFVSDKHDQKTYSSLMNTSTGQRTIYYYSSLQVFKEYPSVLLFGCSFTGNTTNIDYCTKKLIKESSRLLSNPMVLKNKGIEPHNFILTFSFKGGILCSLSVLMFFLSLLYFTKYQTSRDRISLITLILGFFITSSTGFSLSTQYESITFFTVLAIFLSRVNNEDKNEIL